jgi:hypothetical protein
VRQSEQQHVNKTVHNLFISRGADLRLLLILEKGNQTETLAGFEGTLGCKMVAGFGVQNDI